MCYVPNKIKLKMRRVHKPRYMHIKVICIHFYTHGVDACSTLRFMMLPNPLLCRKASQLARQNFSMPSILCRIDVLVALMELSIPIFYPHLFAVCGTGLSNYPTTQHLQSNAVWDFWSFIGSGLVGSWRKRQKMYTSQLRSHVAHTAIVGYSFK